MVMDKSDSVKNSHSLLTYRVCWFVSFAVVAVAVCGCFVLAVACCHWMLLHTAAHGAMHHCLEKSAAQIHVLSWDWGIACGCVGCKSAAAWCVMVSGYIA